MGYGNGVVDWGMQSAPLNLPENQSAGANNFYKAKAEVLERDLGKEINRLGAAVDSWKKTAIEVQAELDTWAVQKKTWEALTYQFRDDFAPHLSQDDLFEKYDKIHPVEQKKYYHKYQSKRTWDK